MTRDGSSFVSPLWAAVFFTKVPRMSSEIDEVVNNNSDESHEMNE
jgi:hypothetical protein